MNSPLNNIYEDLFIAFNSIKFIAVNLFNQLFRGFHLNNCYLNGMNNFSYVLSNIISLTLAVSYKILVYFVSLNFVTFSEITSSFI